ncbi:fibronectin type III domain protein [Ruminiclostridium hungatei]|uniref:Fibronectin type III domain protein n=1 Tax=Ruminiclostridium hungatei TaxID=48256 RepID=A0A1V4SLD1_RUMHU|nr:chitobiase/beta-hexosaminidase C-terminal domain-containing protein [Ruminiclostridium hungatei]OPX44031.1 fibronectin type III domain protein [Ruminiclostridium hungatei]
MSSKGKKSISLVLFLLILFMSLPGESSYLFATAANAKNGITNPDLNRLTGNAKSLRETAAGNPAGGAAEVYVSDSSETEPGPEVRVETPVFSIPAGTYNGAQSIEITCATQGAEIKYTTDGTIPDVNSPNYTGPIIITTATTITAAAYKDGMADSETAAVRYIIEITATDADGSPVDMSLWSCYENPDGLSYTLSAYCGDIADGRILGKVPAVIDGKPVTAMKWTFSGCMDLTVAPEIPESVTELCYTFNNCINLLQAPEIPAGVINMEYAFSACSALLQAPVIPSGVTSLSHTFYNCRKITQAPVIPGSVKNMSYAFAGCTGLVQTPGIPYGVTDMNYAFSRCTGLTAASAIPGSVRNLKYAFSGCTGLTWGPEISDGITDMSYVFTNCSSLTDMPDIPDSVRNMSYAFSFCSSLAQAPAIPYGVTNINGAFSHCGSLVQAPIIPESVTIMSYTFWGCAGLAGDVHIPDSVTELSNIFLETSMPINMLYSAANTAAEAYFAPENVRKAPEGGIETTAAPEFYPAPGIYQGPLTIELSSATTGAAIYYTLDGSEPTAGSICYTGPVNVAETTTVRAVALREGMEASEISRAEYTIEKPLPAIPAGFRTTETSENSITLVWEEAAGADGYELECDGSIFNMGTADQFTHEGLAANSRHTYRIRAKNAQGEGEWSPALVAMTKLLCPAADSISRTDTSVSIGWSAVDGALEYELELNGAVVRTLSLTEHTFTELAPNTGCTIRIRALGTESQSGWSKEYRIYTLLPKPSGIRQTVRATLVQLDWEQTDSATGYDIEIDGEIAAQVIQPSFTSSGIIPGTEHKYRIRAKTASNVGQWSEEIVLRTYLDIPEGISADPLADAVVFSWKGVEGATGYDVSIDNVTIENISETVYKHTGLGPSETHSYKLRARYREVTGEWSQELTVSTPQAGTAICRVSGKNGRAFDIKLSAVDKVLYAQKTFTVTYDPEEAELVDLCTLTQEKELTAADIPEANIKVLRCVPGEITFCIKNPRIIAGDYYKNIINTIQFKAKKDGIITVTCQIQ